MIRKIVFALLLTSGTAQASDWVSAAKSTDGRMELFVDVSSIRTLDPIRRAWIKMVFAHAQKGLGQDKNKWWSYSVTRFAFDCKEETSRSEALTIYYTDGTDLVAPSWGFPTAWAPVPPDTAEGVVMQFICGWKPSPQ
jgi:hypothetical protein